MKKIVAFYFCLFVLVTNAQEQKIQYNEEPLTDVIRDLEQRFQVRFSYNTAILQDVSITYTGQTTLSAMLSFIRDKGQVEITEIDAENFIITEAAFNENTSQYSLDEVVIVSEYVTSGFDQNKENKAITLQPKKLNVLAGLTEPDILQSLQRIPGIGSPTESARLHIRGGTPDQNLLLFDGITVYHGGHFFGMISPFNPYITERVDVFRSGASAVYGSRVAGIIDMKSFEHVPEEFTGSIGSTAIHSDAFVKFPIIKDKLGIVLSGRRSLTDVWNSFTYNSLSDRVFQHTKIEEVNNVRVEEELVILEDKFYYTDFFGKIIFKPNENHKISVSGLLINNDLNHASSDEENEGSSDKLKLQNNGVSFHWKAQYGDSWKTDLKLHYSKYDSKYRFREFNGLEDTRLYVNGNSIDDIGGVISASYHPNKNHKFNFGYDLTKYRVTYDIIDFEDNISINEVVNNRKRVHSGFAEYTFKNDDWYFRAGIRGNYFDNLNDFYLEPRVYGEYSFYENWKLKASAEIRNQGISQLLSFEFDELGLNNKIWALTDEDDIPVLSNKQITSGVQFADRGWKIDVEGYYKRIDGLSSYTKGFRPVNQGGEDYATGSSTVFGVDILVKKRIKKMSLWLGYSLSQNDFRFPELQEGKFYGNFDQKHVLSFSSTFNYKKIQFALGWQYTTGKPFTEATGITELQNDDGSTDFDITYGDLNNKRLPAYHRLDASVMYDFYFHKEKNTKARFGISVINLYNRENEIDKLYRIEGDTTQQLTAQTDIGLGTTLNMVFRVSF
ncbi:TonB-dependent receptor plug domain-containing protein [Kordia sp.]|uniref:TonB-dependent receptor plug domain-containing protein n=1 Tax=Kordia sp. TaxID=1965332 RepID=UPI003D6AA817